MKSREQLYDFGIEAVLAGFWILGLMSIQELSIKKIIFFIIVGLIIIVNKLLPLKFNIMRPGLILVFLFFFPMVSVPKLVLFNNVVEWNVILLFLGILIITVLKWNSKELFFPEGLWFKSLLVSVFGLVLVGILLFTILKQTYELKWSVLFNPIRNLTIYLLIGLLGFQATLDKNRCFRLGIVVFIFSVVMIFSIL